MPRGILFRLNRIRQPSLHTASVPSGKGYALRQFRGLNRPIPIYLHRFLTVHRQINLMHFFGTLRSQGHGKRCTRIVRMFPSIRVLPFNHLCVTLPLSRVFQLRFPTWGRILLVCGPNSSMDVQWAPSCVKWHVFVVSFVRFVIL